MRASIWNMRKRTTAGQLLRKWRKGQAKNQDYVAELFGVTVSCVSDWENGRRTPSALKLVAIQKHTGIPLEAWL